MSINISSTTEYIEEKEYGLENLSENLCSTSEFYAEYKELLDNFTGITFPKKIFENLSDTALRVYKKRLLHLLKRVIIDPDVMQSVKVIRKMITDDNHVYYKARINGAERVFFYIIGSEGNKVIGIFDSTKNHDTQGRLIERYRHDGLPVGEIYYDMKSFLDIYKDFLYDNRKFSDAFGRENRFVHNDIQEIAVNSYDEIRNMCIIGNAGSGKSLVGSNWLRKQLEDSDAKCLYLTMSRALVRSRKSILRSEGLDTEHGKITFCTTFDFFKDYLQSAGYLVDLKDPNESYSHFLSLFQSSSTDFDNFIWRNIHGVIDGYLVNIPEITDSGSNIPPLTADEFSTVNYDVYKDTVHDDKNISYFYSKFDKHGFKNRKSLYQLYKENLKEQNIFDDNDIARTVLSLGYKDLGYTHVFIDECQDLTDVQLFALLYLFKNCKKRLLACDVCQVLQPTYFNIHNPLKYAELLSKDDLHLPDKKLHFNFNYRSTKFLSRFCAKIINELHREMTLNIEYLNEAVSTLYEGYKPMWIRDENKAAEFYQLLDVFSPEIIQVITSESNKAKLASQIENQLVETASECKGMEYNNVVIADIFGNATEALYSDNLWRWRCFYVAATRACEHLIIIETNPESPAYNFLESMLHSDVIEEYSVDHEEFLLEILCEKGTDYLERLANQYKKAGRYKDALRNYLRLKEDDPDRFDFEIEECSIYYNMEDKEYGKAFDAIYHSCYDKEKHIYLDELLRYYDLPAYVYIAASLYRVLSDDMNGVIDNLKKNLPYHCKDKNISDQEIDDITSDICAKYPEIDTKVQTYIANNVKSISQVNNNLSDVLMRIKQE